LDYGVPQWSWMYELQCAVMNGHSISVFTLNVLWKRLSCAVIQNTGGRVRGLLLLMAAMNH